MNRSKRFMFVFVLIAAIMVWNVVSALTHATQQAAEEHAIAYTSVLYPDKDSDVVCQNSPGPNGDVRCDVRVEDRPEILRLDCPSGLSLTENCHERDVLVRGP